MVSTKLKVLISKVYITVSVMTMALMQIKHGCMGIGFIQLVIGIFGQEVKATKRSPPDNLMPWIITQSKVLQERVLKR